MSFPVRNLQKHRHAHHYNIRSECREIQHFCNNISGLCCVSIDWRNSEKGRAQSGETFLRLQV